MLWVSEDGTEWSDIDDAYPSQGEQADIPTEIDSLKVISTYWISRFGSRIR